MKEDSLGASAIWGRIGAAMLLVASFAMQQFGIDFDAEDQRQWYDMIAQIIEQFGSLIAATMVIVSKVRSRKKSDA